MTIGHQGGSSQIKVCRFFEPGRPASMLRCDAWGYAWNDQIPRVYRVCYAVTLVNPLLRGEGFLRVASSLFRVFRSFRGLKRGKNWSFNFSNQNSKIKILKSFVDGSWTSRGRVYGRVNVKNHSVLPRRGRVDG
jgi:hypothetical protein